MSPKHLLLLPALALLLYLGMYSWNQRTHILDTVVSSTGLEISGAVLKTVRFVEDSVMETWHRYLDLVNVREENDALKRQLEQARLRLALATEEHAELLRLRHLLTFNPPEGWESLGVRVLAGRMGPNAALSTVLVGRGYLTGATPGTPAMTPDGIVHRNSPPACRSGKPDCRCVSGKQSSGHPRGRRTRQAAFTAVRFP